VEYGNPGQLLPAQERRPGRLRRTTSPNSAHGVMMDVLRTHPLVIIGGFLQENPFFVPPGRAAARTPRPRRVDSAELTGDVRSPESPATERPSDVRDRGQHIRCRTASAASPGSGRPLGAAGRLDRLRPASHRREPGGRLVAHAATWSSSIPREGPGHMRSTSRSPTRPGARLRRPRPKRSAGRWTLGWTPTTYRRLPHSIADPLGPG